MGLFNVQNIPIDADAPRLDLLWTVGLIIEWARANALPQPYSPNTPIILSSSISAGLENT